MYDWIIRKLPWRWHERLCWHRYERSRFQFQALTYDPGYDVTHVCQKCGKLKIERHD